MTKERNYRVTLTMHNPRTGKAARGVYHGTKRAVFASMDNDICRFAAGQRLAPHQVEQSTIWEDA